MVSDDEIDNLTFRNQLDDELKSANNNYKVARGKALHDVRVESISKAQYHAERELRESESCGTGL